MTSQTNYPQSADNQKILNLKENPAVICHIEMMQGIISRLADNSAKCKEWGFTLLGVLMAITLSTENAIQLNFNICYWILGIFFLLDSYYLGLERKTRTLCNNFINKLNRCDQDIDTYIYSPSESTAKQGWFSKFYDQLKSTKSGMFSFSTLLPYGATLVVLIYFASERLTSSSSEASLQTLTIHSITIDSLMTNSSIPCEFILPKTSSTR